MGISVARAPARGCTSRGDEQKNIADNPKWHRLSRVASPRATFMCSRADTCSRMCCAYPWSRSPWPVKRSIELGLGRVPSIDRHVDPRADGPGADDPDSGGPVQG